MKSQNLWTELRQHIRGSFNIALEASRVSRGLLFHQNVFPADDVHEIVLQYVGMISFYDRLQTVDDFIRSILSSFQTVRDGSTSFTYEGSKLGAGTSCRS